MYLNQTNQVIHDLHYSQRHPILVHLIISNQVRQLGNLEQVLTAYQALTAPCAEAHQCPDALAREPIAGVRKEETAAAEHALDVN